LSDRDAEDLSFHAWVRDLEAVVAELDMERVQLCMKKYLTTTWGAANVDRQGPPSHDASPRTRHRDMHLVIRDLSKTYANGTQALKDVSLDIPRGMFGLLGRNGAGKSTLMRILATLQEPDTGSARLGDMDVLRQKDEVRRTLGYLPQSFGFHPKAKAERLLEHFAILKGIEERGVRRDVVESLLRQTNLWEVRGDRLGTFSGGMRQRFGVAVALLGNPKLIIVDEPTAGLDPEERVRFLNLLSEIGEDSVVILSTHIVEDVEELCSRMAIIDRGEILLETEPLRAVDDLRGRLWCRTVGRDELRALETELRLVSTKLLAGRTIVQVYAEASPGAEFESVDPDLKDVYFSAMAGHHARRAAETAL
jgi:ABC-type multidrug transport system ATPase subunit